MLSFQLIPQILQSRFWNGDNDVEISEVELLEDVDALHDLRDWHEKALG